MSNEACIALRLVSSRLAWLFAVGIALAGCAPPRLAASAFLDQTLASKASFDLQCPKDQLRYTDLGGEQVGGPFTYNDTPLVAVGGADYMLDTMVRRQQGVSGCGRRASYSYVQGEWLGSGATPPKQP